MIVLALHLKELSTFTAREAKLSFIKRIIGPDERLIGLSGAHWVYGLKGLLWLVCMLILGLTLKYFLYSSTDFLRVPAFAIFGGYAFWTCVAMGALMFFFYFLVMISTEIALTTKRVIYKRGLIAVDVREVDLEEVKAAGVNNGWFGRFLNYGYLLLDARFVTNLQLPAISDPYRFVKALNDVRAHIKADSMRVVLGDARGVSAAPVPAQRHPQLGEERYQALSNNPVIEMEQALSEVQDQKSFRRAKIKDLKPVAFDKIGLRDKVKSSFHMIAHYGNKF
jgi:hypothetical protein